MKRILSASLTFTAAAVLVALTGVTAVHAQCTNATLTGNYGVIWSGFTAPGKAQKGNEVPWAGAGVVTFDGAGNFSTSYSGAVNGSVFTGSTAEGTYVVNSDCTGSLAFTSGAGAGFTANSVIIGGGAEVFAACTNPGSTLALDLKRQ
jgi:hypothetical protein